MQSEAKQSTIHLPAVAMLRGLASLGVCFMHFCGTVKSETLNQIGHFGGYGVPVFFIISGFILPYALYHSSYKINNYHQFLLKRILRLDPPYLLSILGIFALSFLAQYSSQHSAPPIEIATSNNALHLFYLVDIFHGTWLNPVFWTLAIEFQFYLVIGLLFPLLIKQKAIVRGFFFLCCCALPFLWKDERFIGASFHLFTAGFLYFAYQSKRIDLRIFLLCGLVLLTAVYFKSGFSWLTCIVFAWSFLIFLKKTIRALVFLGTISYSLYLIHTPFGTDGLIQFMHNYIPSETGRIILLFSAIPVTIFAAWLFYRCIEKPSMRWAKKIRFR